VKRIGRRPGVDARSEHTRSGVWVGAVSRRRAMVLHSEAVSFYAVGSRSVASVFD
jgi:hypothetical protein